MQSDDTLTLRYIYEETIRNRVEIKELIQTSETKIISKIGALHEKIKKLEDENLLLNEKIESLERQNRRKNIVIFGVDKPIHEITPDFICSEIKELLEIDLKQSDISDVHPLGKNKERPIKVELSSYLKKRDILRNCSKLKGKQVSISQDLTVLQRQNYKVLRKHMIEAKKNNCGNCFIRGEKLHINKRSYTVDELLAEEELFANRKSSLFDTASKSGQQSSDEESLLLEQSIEPYRSKRGSKQQEENRTEDEGQKGKSMSSKSGDNGNLTKSARIKFITRRQ